MLLELVNAFYPAAYILFVVAILHELIELLVFLLLHGLSVLLVLLYNPVGNNPLVVLELTGQLLKLVVQVFHLLPDIAVPVPQLQLADEMRELVVQFHRLFEVLFVDLLSQMFVQFALLDDLFVDFALGFGSLWV